MAALNFALLRRGKFIVLMQVNRPPFLLARVESAIESATYGRVRDLTVEDLAGCVVVKGSVPSHHTKQLALQALMDQVPTGRFRALITVRPRPKDQDSSAFLAKAY